MIRNLMIGALAVAVVGTGVWGYQQKNDKEHLAQAAENMYQRAYHDLSFHIDQIEDELGKTMAMNSQRQLSPALADVWRVTSLAEKSLAELPVQGLNMEDTEKYLYKIADFSYRTSVRDLNQEPLTDDEYKTLEQLYEQSASIRQSMRETQAMMMNTDMHWLAEREREDGDSAQHSFADHFERMNKSVQGFSEVEWGATDSAIRNLNGELKDALEGREEVTKEEAKQSALELLQLGKKATVRVDDASDALDYPAYSLVIDDPENKANYNMDMSVEGGEPIWFMQSRKIDKQTIGLNEAVQKAEAFLERANKENMVLVESTQYNNRAVLEFAYEDNGVRIYPDSITLEVALDDGDIVSYVGRGHIIHHQDSRNLPTPAITKADAQGMINPRIEIMEDHLAVIETDLNEDVLVYEFYGTKNNDTYRIFINAQTGDEEKVERMKDTEPDYSNE
ncbi:MULTISPECIES: germination protein YpeB [Shouchella]|uniref:Germination protein YpeB n=3 Tax=Shouchella TaxID=2893057 RepID=A0ABY7W3S7_9BACI|nr:MULTISPECIES: germination protein YpeB [Shouchella]MED4127092.1 germination protein YpeB [Shouchella miscanthi]WDF03578.1 germination protein YpeB [Shouchella hunanensis]